MRSAFFESAYAAGRAARARGRISRRAREIGVVKEIKADEYRVALTRGARSSSGVVTRSGRGRRGESALSDAEYAAVGAKLRRRGLGRGRDGAEGEGRCRRVPAAPTWADPVHVPPPRGEQGLTLRWSSGATCVAYETVETSSGALPLLAPMSEIAGRLAAQAGAYFLEKPQGGRGLLLGGVAGVAPGRVVVIGGGIVGYNAAVIAIGLGANVTILERSIDRMRYLDEILSGRVSLVMSSTLQIEESIGEADVVIGAVLIPGAKAPKLITRPMLGEMKEGPCDVRSTRAAGRASKRPPTPIRLRRRRCSLLRRDMPGRFR
jgi:alanine dehydrogenase